ncbi:MAG: MBL fold metallo-hydrolase [Gammaproteobacteria bacterium]|nr:MBL fold metallo-hydrolase [Gammaproteobacteria bacterium]
MTNHEGLIVEQIQIGPMANFTYIIGSSETREVVLVDPAWDLEHILNRVEDNEYTVAATLVTHYHPDHVGGHFFGHDIAGVADLVSTHPVKVYVHKLEADGLKQITGLSESDLVRVDSGDSLDLGGVLIEFLHTPGHTPGSQCFRIKNTLIAGDTLFIDGCGRVDLPGSDRDAMFHSLQKLKSLPDDTILLPGHNYSKEPTASIGTVKQTNAYLRVHDLNTWRCMI